MYKVVEISKRDAFYGDDIPLLVSWEPRERWVDGFVSGDGEGVDGHRYGFHKVRVEELNSENEAMGSIEEVAKTTSDAIREVITNEEEIAKRFADADIKPCPLDKQVGGGHYKTMGIQPLEHTYANYGYIGLKAAVHTKVDKYLGRNKDNEVEDIQKAIHCLEILLEKAKREEQ